MIPPLSTTDSAPERTKSTCYNANATELSNTT